MDELDRLLDLAKSSQDDTVEITLGDDEIKNLPVLSQSGKFTDLKPSKVAKPAIKSIPVAAAKKSKEPETAGPNWFNFPRQEMTPELKRDLQLLQMRHVLDSKRFYKKSSLEDMKYVAVGTIKEDASEFYSSRLSRKNRKQTLAEEILATNAQSFTEKYKKIQAAKQSGRKAHMKKLKFMRS